MGLPDSEQRNCREGGMSAARVDSKEKLSTTSQRRSLWIKGRVKGPGGKLGRQHRRTGLFMESLGTEKRAHVGNRKGN